MLLLSLVSMQRKWTCGLVKIDQICLVWHQGTGTVRVCSGRLEQAAEELSL